MALDTTKRINTLANAMLALIFFIIACSVFDSYQLYRQTNHQISTNE